MHVQVEVLAVHRDSRGIVFEPMESGGLREQRNVHVVLSAPGQVRGNHYHRLGTEVLVVQGPALVRLKELDRIRDCRVPEGEVHRFVIPPDVPHAVRYEGAGVGVLVGFNSQAHDPKHPDSVREVLL